jgi:hypothetical protein
MEDLSIGFEDESSWKMMTMKMKIMKMKTTRRMNNAGTLWKENEETNG